MNYHKAISKNIKRLCKTNGINYSQLAKEAGIALTSLQNLLYDTSRKEPRISTVHAIAKALKVSIDELLK